MRHIMWEPDPLETHASRAEKATVGDYELVVLDTPSKAPQAPSLITWELLGPPDGNDTWGEASTFEEAKTKAEEALAKVNHQT